MAIELTVTGLPNMIGGEFVNLPPTRILDTRDGNGRAKVGPMTENETTVLQVAGRGGVPSDAKAVALNVTADASTTGGWISVFPAARGFQGTSSVNFAPNETAPNMVIMALDNDGRLGILNCCGTTTVIIDVLGWITDDKAVRVGGRMAPIVPFRMADTRSGAEPLGPGEIRSFQMEPMKGIVINLTAIGATEDTYLTVFEEGRPLPIASNLNVTAGTNRANVAIAPVSFGGRISVYNARGKVHIAIDRLATIIQNDLVGQTTAGRIVTGTPQRLFDTREVKPLGARSAVSFDMGHLEVSGVLINLTATEPTKSTWVSAVGMGPIEFIPQTSTLNVEKGQTIANAALLKTFLYAVPPRTVLGFYNDAGSVHLVADLVGFIT
jgi:co-chaperonin GroES (HSP10)